MPGWALDGPVKTEVAEARRMLYSLSHGAEGVGGATDLKVMPLVQPGPGVRVLPGSALMRSMYGQSGNESYLGSRAVQQTLGTTPTGSQVGGRADVIAMLVKDPWAVNSPHPEPSNPLTYEGFPLEVISGVPAGVRRLRDIPGYQNATGYALARLDFPPNTGTVGQGGATIVDLRAVANSEPDEWRTVKPTVVQDFRAETWARWITPAEWSIEIPEWATHALIDLDVLNPIHIEADNYGQIGCFVNNVRAAVGDYAHDWAGTTARLPAFASDEFVIPSSFRGKPATFDLRGIRLSGAGALRADTRTKVRLKVRFIAKAT